MNFTKEHIDVLMAALPGCVDEQSRQLFPLILEEWGRVDLEEHQGRSTVQRLRTERKAMDEVGRLAGELARAVTKLDPDCKWGIAGWLADSAIGARVKVGRRWLVERFVHRLDEEPGRLADAALKTAASWGPHLRRKTLVRQLILEDLAAIFEYATRERAGRRVRGKDHPEKGKDYGPFWDFANAAWLVIFQSPDGLSGAVRRWNEVRADHNAQSPAIANMRLRHPEWRI